MRKAVFFFVVFLIFSCKSDTDFEKPKDLIPKDQMIDILVDLHLAVGAMNTNNIKNKKSNNYTFLIYNKYGVDSLRFMESNRYYASRVDDYYKMFDKVRIRLEKLNDKYDALAKKDSLEHVKMDSILKSRKRRIKGVPKTKKLK